MPLFQAGTAPSNKVLLFTSALNAATWTAVDLRSSGWANDVNARVARIDARIIDPEEGDSLDFAFESSPDTAFLSADSTVALSLPFPDELKAHTWYWKTSGALNVQVAVWYNIKPDGYV